MSQLRSTIRIAQAVSVCIVSLVHHGSELPYHERIAMQSRTLLRKDGGSPHPEVNENENNQVYRCEQDQQATSHDHVNRPFDSQAKSSPQINLHLNSSPIWARRPIV